MKIVTLKLVQSMEDGEPLVSGLSALQNVEEEHRPDLRNATTLLQRMVALNVKGKL